MVNLGSLRPKLAGTPLAY